MFRDEFKVVAKGSNENNSIYGAKDPVTTGAHRDSTNRRMISHYGLEDCCGCMWQWGRTPGLESSTSNWGDIYNDSVDSQKYGKAMSNKKSMNVLGGYWASGINSGSRAYSSAALASNSFFLTDNIHPMIGARGSSDPKIP